MAFIVNNADVGFGTPINGVYAKISNVTYEFIEDKFEIKVDYYINKDARNLEKDKIKALQQISSKLKTSEDFVNLQNELNKLKILYDEKESLTLNIKREDLSDNEKSNLQPRLLKINEDIKGFENKLKTENSKIKKYIEQATKNIQIISSCIYGASSKDINLCFDKNQLIKNCYNYLRKTPDFKRVENDLW